MKHFKCNDCGHRLETDEYRPQIWCGQCEGGVYEPIWPDKKTQATQEERYTGYHISVADFCDKWQEDNVPHVVSFHIDSNRYGAFVEMDYCCGESLVVPINSRKDMLVDWCSSCDKRLTA